MNNLKSESGEIAKPTTYRITDTDKKVLVKEHGNLAKFLNAAVAKEVKRIAGKKKSVKSKAKLKT